MSDELTNSDTLAINGGDPAKQRPDPPMYPGGMSLDAEEEAAVMEAIRNTGRVDTLVPMPRADSASKRRAVMRVAGGRSGDTAAPCRPCQVTPG